MRIIDVTLRDGGHAVNFDWPIEFVKEYYETLSSFKQIEYLELGYWKQTAKTNNTFYNLNFDTIEDIVEGKKNSNVSIMIDYHYCLKNLSEYPKDDQNIISLIRMCARKEDLDDALKFGKELKKYTNLSISLNIFNSSNYKEEELISISNKVKNYPFDCVYYADTHGSLEFDRDFKVFKKSFEIYKRFNINTGFHLHDHSGKAYFNYKYLTSQNVDFTDTSIRGMGKGSGNLRLEYLINNSDSTKKLLSLILKYEDLLNQPINPYDLISSMFSVSDNYSKQAQLLNISVNEFYGKCKSIKGTAKDSFDKSILQ